MPVVKSFSFRKGRKKENISVVEVREDMFDKMGTCLERRVHSLPGNETKWELAIRGRNWKLIEQKDTKFSFGTKRSYDVGVVESFRNGRSHLVATLVRSVFRFSFFCLFRTARGERSRVPRNMKIERTKVIESDKDKKKEKKRNIKVPRKEG